MCYLRTIAMLLLFSFCYAKKSTTTSKPDQPTDEEYDKMENVDEGVYTPQKFVSINTQFASLNAQDYCEDNYVKCLVSLTNTPTPVCAYHGPSKPTGQFTFPSYCDMMFDNCRRGLRHWRLLGYGICHYDEGWMWSAFDVVPGDVIGNTKINLTRRWLPQNRLYTKSGISKFRRVKL